MCAGTKNLTQEFCVWQNQPPKMRVKLRHSRINKNGKDLSLVDLLYRTNSRESCQLKQNRGVYSSAEDRSTELQGA